MRRYALFGVLLSNRMLKKSDRPIRQVVAAAIRKAQGMLGAGKGYDVGWLADGDRHLRVTPHIPAKKRYGAIYRCARRDRVP